MHALFVSGIVVYVYVHLWSFLCFMAYHRMKENRGIIKCSYWCDSLDDHIIV